MRSHVRITRLGKPGRSDSSSILHHMILPTPDPLIRQYPEVNVLW